MKPFQPTIPRSRSIPHLRLRLLLLSVPLALVPALHADQPWGITYNEWLNGATGAAGGGYNVFDQRKGNETNPLNGSYGVPQSPLFVQDSTAVSSAGGSSAVAGYSLATKPGLYWGHINAEVGYGTPAANSAGANFGAFVGGAPNLGSRDEFVVSSGTLPADTTVTLRETLTLAFDGAVHNNTPSPIYGTLPVQFTMRVADDFDGNNPISVSFDQTSPSGLASVSFNYSVQVGHRYTFHPQFFFSSRAESNATAQTATDLGYDLVMAGSAGFNFPDSDASALTNSGTDYGQNNLSAAYALAVP